MMSDLTTILGRLLSDAEFRSQFFSNRATTVGQFGLAPSSVEVLLQLDEETFERQSLSLIDKRFHEVTKMVPKTIYQLGENAHVRFREYAARFWPQTHHRHLIDALEFCRYLEDHHQLGLVCSAERNVVQFRLSQRWLAIHWLSNYSVNGKRRLAIQLLTRSSEGPPIEYIWYLRLPVHQLLGQSARTSPQ